jgi:hypothetical protein
VEYKNKRALRVGWVERYKLRNRYFYIPRVHRTETIYEQPSQLKLIILTYTWGNIRKRKYMKGKYTTYQYWIL